LDQRRFPETYIAAIQVAAEVIKKVGILAIDESISDYDKDVLRSL
jgi:hypothetical protein